MLAASAASNHGTPDSAAAALPRSDHADTPGPVEPAGAVDGGRPSLKSNFKWTFGGNIVYAAAQFGMISAFTRLTDANTTGYYFLAGSVVTSILAFSRLQLHQVQVTDARNEFQFQDYFATRILTSLLTVVAAIIAAFLLLKPQADHYWLAVWMFVWVGVARSIDAVGEIVRGLFQRHERMDLNSGSLVWKGLLGLAAVGGCLLLTRSPLIAVIAMAIVWGANLFLYDLRHAARLISQRNQTVAGESLMPRFHFARIGPLVWSAAPIGVGMFLLDLRETYPRVLLEQTHKADTLAHFGAMSYLSTAAGVIVSALGQSAAPRLADYFVFRFQSYVQLLWKLMAIGVGLGIVYVGGVALVGPPLIAVFFGEEYSRFPVDFVLIAVAGALNFPLFFGGVALAAARAFHVQMIAGIVSCIAAFIGATLLIPKFGLTGAAINTAISAAVTVVCYGTGLFFAIRARGREGDLVRTR